MEKLRKVRCGGLHLTTLGLMGGREAEREGNARHVYQVRVRRKTINPSAVILYGLERYLSRGSTLFNHRFTSSYSKNPSSHCLIPLHSSLQNLQQQTSTIIMARKAKEENLEDMPTSINPYEVLGVEEKSTADQIKSAYRKQALKHHPGQNDFTEAPVDFVRSNIGVR